MFGLKKSSNPEETLPNPPSTEDILEDLNKAGPDDVVFTTNIADLSANLDQTSRNFQLQKRFQVITTSIWREKFQKKNWAEKSREIARILQYFAVNNFNLTRKCMKITQNVELKFLILAFSINFCPIKSDLSDNTVWPQALWFQKFAKICRCLVFLMNFCLLKM